MLVAPAPYSGYRYKTWMGRGLAERTDILLRTRITKMSDRLSRFDRLSLSGRSLNSLTGTFKHCDVPHQEVKPVGLLQGPENTPEGSKYDPPNAVMQLQQFLNI